MKRINFIKTLAAGTLACIALGNVAALAAPATNTAGTQNKRVLIAYFSWSGNTRAVAETIAKNTGAEIFEIVPETPYPTQYRKCTQQAKKEIAEKFRPKLKTALPNFDEFDVVFVGSPNWWGTYAPPVATFLDDPALAKKTIVPFFTHGGGGMQRCESDMKKHLPSAKFLKAMTLSGSDADDDDTEDEIKSWLQNIGFGKN